MFPHLLRFTSFAFPFDLPDDPNSVVPSEKRKMHIPFFPFLTIILHLLSNTSSSPFKPPDRLQPDSLTGFLPDNDTLAVTGWGDCFTCAMKCGLFFCSCAVVCDTPLLPQPASCYVRLPWPCHHFSLEYYTVWDLEGDVYMIQKFMGQGENMNCTLG